MAEHVAKTAAGPSWAALILRRLCLLLLSAYRLVLSPLLAPACRFHPTCSVYAQDAIGRYGVLKGIAMAGRRLLKCHPFHPGGIDPVR
ncbi:membrane protein insertion efficiency factor YidD [Nitrospirales bacterium NOB]|mgnify:CR=1 FL=1|nr:membrane protein insertion efficiency factor YidD [Nitrospira sp. NTP2]MCK6493927.1 membrane protein insertion efficiency factor YidD [Nitrospira sp.]MDL1888913.1 membrane protein insertion efficiency factor YidD [Nitrospirales bacterium NOB]MEB2338264.1 membrane protein insertion efficiency factor YidD [Nitrospirales bacterium]MCK6499508.1 membrane protein insertion efficiency factor YidD [Nitrospira sp.]